MNEGDFVEIRRTSDLVRRNGKSGQFAGDNLTRTMSSTSTQRSVRHIRRSVRWQALKEYVGGALWVLPTAAALIALVVGLGISQIGHHPGPD
jgi:hypothetical protein